MNYALTPHVLPSLPIRYMYCIGHNFVEHAREMDTSVEKSKIETCFLMSEYVKAMIVCQGRSPFSMLFGLQP